MRYSVFLFLLVALLSCTNNGKSDLERRREQVRADMERAKKMEADNKADSLAALAWGDAVWGMTRNEVLKTKAFRNGGNTDYYIEMNDERKQKTKQTFGLKNLFSLRAYIKDDCLSAIFIDSWSVKVGQFDELVRECIFLKNGFYHLYGRPTVSNYVSFSGFDKDGNQLVAEYKAGSSFQKIITITLHKSGYDYCYKVSIYPLSANRELSTLSRMLEKFDGDSNEPDDVSVFSF